MIIMTARLPRRKLALWGLAGLGLLCCALFVHISQPWAPDVSTAAQTQVKVKTAQDRLYYLAGYGWQVAENPLAVEELIIPKEFDDSYTEYLALQSGQGFDLTRYPGKRVKRYTYEITNYPTGETGVQVNLLIYKNRVIGGEVLSPRMDGFLHGLTMPQA